LATGVPDYNQPGLLLQIRSPLPGSSFAAMGNAQLVGFGLPFLHFRQ
jgi:hypothetical protein